MATKRRANKTRGADRGGIRKDPRGDSTTVIARERQLEHCKPYRVWLNDTGAARARTVSIFPVGDNFLANTVTVFVAPANHQQGPPAGGDTSVVKPEGDSIGKNVPNGNAVFVHLDKPPSGKKKAQIDDGP